MIQIAIFDTYSYATDDSKVILSESKVSRWEKGKHAPSEHLLSKITCLAGVTVAELHYGAEYGSDGGQDDMMQTLMARRLKSARSGCAGGSQFCWKNTSSRRARAAKLISPPSSK